jgi:hypothetical protein
VHDWRRDERNSAASDCAAVAEGLIDSVERRASRPAAHRKFFLDHQNFS